MQEFASLSAETPVTLTEQLNAKAADGWALVSIHTHGGSLVAFVSRSANGAAAPAATAPAAEAAPAAAVNEPAGWASAPAATAAPAAAPVAAPAAQAAPRGAAAIFINPVTATRREVATATSDTNPVDAHMDP